MHRSIHGGRHELGQNFLHHQPTIQKITSLVAGTSGAILEIGAGDGSLTRPLAKLGRELIAIDIDEHRVAKLRKSMPGITVEHADALAQPLTTPIVVANIPFHITTPILRRLLSVGSWQHAVLLTQWEVARKRAGVGGNTMMTAQAAPWFSFDLHGRVPSRAFAPQPSVDAGILTIQRRTKPLVPKNDRKSYEQFIRKMFTGKGKKLAQIVQRASGADRNTVFRAFDRAQIDRQCLPRDIGPEQWAVLWRNIRK